MSGKSVTVAQDSLFSTIEIWNQDRKLSCRSDVDMDVEYAECVLDMVNSQNPTRPDTCSIISNEKTSAIEFLKNVTNDICNGIETHSITKNNDLSNSNNNFFGDLLDAGTGVASLKWIRNLNCSSVTAVTASQMMKDNIICSIGRNSNKKCEERILIGDWSSQHWLTNEILLRKEYDTVIADYLIGAVDGFAPYNQDIVLERIIKMIKKPRGRMYFVGMEPIVQSNDENIVVEVHRARDSCILLANEKCYREHPLEWVKRHIVSDSRKHDGLKIFKEYKFPILHSWNFLNRQIKVAETKLPKIQDIQLRASMTNYLKELRARAKKETNKTIDGNIPYSFDYVLEIGYE